MLRAVINDAYRISSDSDCTVLKAKAHEISSIDVSLLFKKNFVVQHVMWASTRISQIISNLFYLRNIIHRSMDTIFFPFLIMVVAQQV